DILQVQLEAGEIVVLPRRVRGGWLSLAPSNAMGGMAIEWECRTNIESFVDSVCSQDTRSFPPLAPSFDCAHAAGPITQAICQDHDLMRQDRDLWRELEGLRSMLSPEQLYRMDRKQQEFLQSRSRTCEKLQPHTRRTCIEEETAERIRDLRRSQPTRS
ncbi:MAG: lysozyme inhibitor LprI family protein, partial [Myxococcota bacterium]